MPQIETLVKDIKLVLENPSDFPDVDEGVVGRDFGVLFSQRFNTHGNPMVERKGELRASNVGVPCKRDLWYRVNRPEKAEPLGANARFKFFYGDIVELSVLELARKAGHTVCGEQRELVVNGIKGHRDAVIDGVVVDVKSASPYSFDRFKFGLQPEDDKFGYLTQLKFYLLASRDDPLVVDKNRAGFLAVEKVSGDICLDLHTFTDKELDEVKDHIEEMKAAVADKDTIPERAFEDIPEGKSGNRKLDVNCSYCAFKNECWPDLKTYIYAKGPVFLTHVEREPKVERF